MTGEDIEVNGSGRTDAGYTAPAKGLTLMSVEY